MIKKVSLRKAIINDMPAIRDLVYELAVYEKAASEFVASLEDYNKNFEEGIFQAILAEVEGKIVGMVLYYPAYSTWKGKMMYLEDFVVLEEYRGYGVGSQLFDAFIEDAKIQACKMVKWQVLDWNEPALAFYQKKHATIEKEWWNGKLIFDNE
ncbi:MAG: GNAT family N-acetyltransferase [Chitinophagales bacterium]|nr:GNAT family N-acetyltransferase [Chitinophagales bacterium]